MDRTDLTRIDDYQWEVPPSYREGMRVPVRLFATEALAERIAQAGALEQAVQVAMLPGIVGQLVVMPDVQVGEGAPIGMVAAMKYPVGVISPAAVGHDINSGMRLLGSDIQADALEGDLDALADALQEHVPSGADAEGSLSLSKNEVDHIARSGAQWALRKDMADQDDLVRTEEGGRLNEADPEKVSDEARGLGAAQLGTLSGSEHFIEVGVVEEVVNQAAAITMGLKEGTLAVQIHCGARGYGHQICADYIERFQEESKKHGIDLPNPELACVPLDTKSAKDYMGAMRAAANYAYANRQVLTHRVREAFAEVLGETRGGSLHTVYDVAHNLGQIEMHEVGDRHLRCYVHRKGAARAFGPGTPGISLPYRALGQPVLVPGRMGESSWVLLGTLQSMQKSFGSACHGVERGAASAGGPLEQTLKDGNVRVRSGGAPAREAAGGEAVQVQEDIDSVVETVAGARLASKVARLRPVAVMHA